MHVRAHIKRKLNSMKFTWQTEKSLGFVCLFVSFHSISFQFQLFYLLVFNSLSATRTCLLCDTMQWTHGVQCYQTRSTHYYYFSECHIPFIILFTQQNNNRIVNSGWHISVGKRRWNLFTSICSTMEASLHGGCCCVHNDMFMSNIVGHIEHSRQMLRHPPQLLVVSYFSCLFSLLPMLLLLLCMNVQTFSVARELLYKWHYDERIKIHHTQFNKSICHALPIHLSIVWNIYNGKTIFWNCLRTKEAQKRVAFVVESFLLLRLFVVVVLFRFVLWKKNDICLCTNTEMCYIFHNKAASNAPFSLLAHSTE